MRIRKAYQGTVPENKILDTYSTSQTDTYSCNFTNSFNAYSETEKRTGTWTDGKPMYRKVYNSSSSSGSSMSLTIPIDNGIDTIARLDVYLLTTLDNGYQITESYYRSANDFFRYWLTYTTTSKVINLDGAFGSSRARQVRAIIECRITYRAQANKIL